MLSRISWVSAAARARHWLLIGQVRHMILGMQAKKRLHVHKHPDRETLPKKLSRESCLKKLKR
jgi:hypothetical protein